MMDNGLTTQEVVLIKLAMEMACSNPKDVYSLLNYGSGEQNGNWFQDLGAYDLLKVLESACKKIEARIPELQ